MLKTKAVSGLDPRFTDAPGSVRMKYSSVGNLTFQVWAEGTLSDELMGEVQVPLKVAHEISQRTKKKVALILRPRDRESDPWLVEHAAELGSLTVEFTATPDAFNEKPGSRRAPSSSRSTRRRGCSVAAASGSPTSSSASRAARTV